ncbi:MAG TPA: glycoside hydrolase family 127 protein [Candidatus Paceibacterota bacterium]|nr:glycoside hydrolase family 127 protein [Verrucomicrobiota bacterium]HRY46800.1 glycoside hydrolase family 127 protein [Candidatus Paceibacterota bacterium]
MKTSYLNSALITFGSMAALCAWPADLSAAPAAPAQVNYARPFESTTRRAFIPLPAGAVEPAGWLRDWCLAARDGFTGHMDEYDAEFKRAWSPDHKMTGERLDWPKGGWPYEGGGYWFDGLVRLGYMLRDETLIQQAKRRLDVVVTNMNSDAILFLWWLNRNKPEDRQGSIVSEAWPMWANGLLGRALAGYYDASRDLRVLRTLESSYSGDRDWLRLGWAMSNPWPAFDTYTWTGNPEIAAALTALFSKDGGGMNPGGTSWNRYRQRPDEKPSAEKKDHVVHFLESTTPWALGYLWTGNREFLDATLAWHDLLEREAMQPSGVPVADEYYGPTGAFRGTETCDVAAYLWSQIALLTVSGQGRLADRAERAFFNAGPATVARDFKTHVYFQCPNRFVDKSPPHPHGPQAEGNSYKRTHYPLCCTAALNRIVPWYVSHLWMATYENGLAATHYSPCKVSALVADRVPVEIVCRTDYPFDDLISMSVKPERGATFPLTFRIPGWCKHPMLSVNGTALNAMPDAKGFVRVERLWVPGDTIRLRLPMSASVITGRDRNAQDAPYASVSYGPLLFALPIPDGADGNTPDAAAKWNYALDVQQPGLTVERGPMPPRWDWPLAAPLKLRANAIEVTWTPDPKAPQLPLEPADRSKPTQPITLVPYGCTKFRISMFPVTSGP